MSVNLHPLEILRRADEFRLIGPVKHTLIFYGGYLLPERGGGLGGTQMAKFESTEAIEGGELAGSDSDSDVRWRYRTCAEAWDKLKPYFDHRIPLNSDLDGGLDSGAVRAGEAYLVPHQGPSPFDPRGKLIIYGYSAGGFNAISLCRSINQSLSWYDFNLKRIGVRPSSPNSSRFAQIKIDLLITVDPCRILLDPERRDPAAGADRHTPGGTVDVHVNYFQEEDDDGIIGAEILGIPRRPQKILAIDPVGAHNRMPIVTLQSAKAWLRVMIGADQVH